MNRYKAGFSVRSLQHVFSTMSHSTIPHSEISLFDYFFTAMHWHGESSNIYKRDYQHLEVLSVDTGSDSPPNLNLRGTTVTTNTSAGHDDVDQLGNNMKNINLSLAPSSQIPVDTLPPG